MSGFPYDTDISTLRERVRRLQSELFAAERALQFAESKQADEYRKQRLEWIASQAPDPFMGFLDHPPLTPRG